MQFSPDLSHCLAFAPLDTPVMIARIADDTLREYCDQHGVHEGDTVTCREPMAPLMVVIKDRHHRVTLAPEHALLIAIEPPLAA